MPDIAMSTVTITDLKYDYLFIRICSRIFSEQVE